MNCTVPEDPVTALATLEPVKKSLTVTVAFERLGAPGLTSVNSSCAVTCKLPTCVETQSKVKGTDDWKFGPTTTRAPE